MPVMPLQGVDGFSEEGLNVYCIHVTNEGKEQREDGRLLSDKVVERLQQNNQPITDVILVTHGYMNGRREGMEFCHKWLQSMASCREDVRALRQARGGAFQPLLVGLCWPSMPHMLPGWRDTRAFFAGCINVRRWGIEALPAIMPYMVFGRFEPRARRVGSRAGQRLLRRLKEAELQREGDGGGSPGAPVRYHVMGHSLGAQLACSMLHPSRDRGEAAPREEGREELVIDTLVLVQGAVHTSCFDSGGQFSLVPSRVRGVVLVTHTTRDKVLLGYANLGRGGTGRAIGSFGARLPRGEEQWSAMEDAGHNYRDWQSGVINVDALNHMLEDGPVGVHSNFLHPPVMHAFWSAILASDGGVGGTS